MNADSVDKIVTRYFACLTRAPFTYKGKEYLPKPVTVSPLLLRGYTCPEGCGACCLKFSLDYLPSEDRPKGCAPRCIDFNNKEVVVYTDFQPNNDGTYCRHLRREDGRCGIYPVRPFSCDFELIRPLIFKEETRPNSLTQKLYGRQWNMPRVDGERGGLCEMTPVTQETRTEVVRKLKRLRLWEEHFGVVSWTGDIIALIEAKLLTSDVTFNDNRRKGITRC